MENKGVMREIRMDIRSDLAMNLISYLIKEENFIFVGNEQEVWLENLSHPAVQLLYLNQRKIFNDEQALLIRQQLYQVRNRIRRRYLLPHLNVLILNLDELSAPMLEGEASWLKTVSIKDAVEAGSNPRLRKYFPSIEESALDRKMTDLIVEIQTVTKSKAMEIHKTLSFQKKPYVTYSFLGLILIVFIIFRMYAGNPVQTLTAIHFGAKYNPLIAAGEYWRLLSASLLHADVFHLLFNAIFILQFGKLLETVLGWWRMIVLFIGSAIVGSLFSYAFVPQVSLGASTIAYGVLGGLLFMGLENRKMFMGLVRRIVFPILAFSVLWTFLNTTGDVFGHIGGFLGGFLTASLLGLPSYRPYLNRLILAGASLGLLTFGLYSRGMELVRVTDYRDFNLALILYHVEQGRLDQAQRLVEKLGLEDFFY